MTEQNNISEGLSNYLNQLHSQLETDDLIKLRFENLVKFIPYYDGGYELDKETITFLSDHLEKHSLDSEPRIRDGFVKRQVDSPIFIYKNTNSFNHHSNSYRHAFLMVRMAVIMSIVDGIVDNDELLQIRRMIWGMNFLSLSEKNALFAKANYFMSEERELDAQDRDYKRIAINREQFVEKIPELSKATANALLQVAQDIAIADGLLDRGELLLLRDIYRSLGMSARSTKSDLKMYAAQQYIQIDDNENDKLLPEEELDEIDNVLGDLLFDYDEF